MAPQGARTSRPWSDERWLAISGGALWVAFTIVGALLLYDSDNLDVVGVVVLLVFSSMLALISLMILVWFGQRLGPVHAKLRERRLVSDDPRVRAARDWPLAKAHVITLRSSANEPGYRESAPKVAGLRLPAEYGGHESTLELEPEDPPLAIDDRVTVLFDPDDPKQMIAARRIPCALRGWFDDTSF